MPDGNRNNVRAEAEEVKVRNNQSSKTFCKPVLGSDTQGEEKILSFAFIHHSEAYNVNKDYQVRDPRSNL